MDKNTMRDYAGLIAVMGANIQKGQECVINAELDQPEFVTMLAEECYKAGAARVTVEWTHKPITKLHAAYQSEEKLGRVEEWEVEKLTYRRDTLPMP